MASRQRSDLSSLLLQNERGSLARQQDEELVVLGILVEPCALIDDVVAGRWADPETGELWQRMGDIGRVDEEGFVELVGRAKDMIISGGFNIYPQMVEQAIYEHPDVEEVLVIGIADGYRGEAAKAFVKLRTGATPFSLDELRGFLDGRVGRHEMPAALEFRDALPRTPVGKLSKIDLKQEEAARHQAARAS